MGMTAPYKAAIIGCGHRAAAHIEAYYHIPEASVVACCAPSPLRREPLAAEYGLCAYADVAEMIERERPDIVHFITRPDVRVHIMSLVAEFGVPLCTVEKPVAAGVGDWLELQRLEARSRTKFAICHQFRWHPGLMRCQDAVRGGCLGEVALLDISSGMNIAGQGTHSLNYGRSLVGDPRVRSVFGQWSGWDKEDSFQAAPSSTFALLEFENGIRGIWTSGPVSPRVGDPSTNWQHVRVAAHAKNGRVNYEEFGRWEIVSASGTETGDYGNMGAWASKNLEAQAGFYRAMFRWLEDDSSAPGTNLAVSLHEWAVVLALYQSCLERCPIDMDGFRPHEDLLEHIKR